MSNIDCRISTSANWNKITKKMKLWNFFNSSRLPCGEATAPKGAAAHSLGTTALYNSFFWRFINSNIWHPPTTYLGRRPSSCSLPIMWQLLFVLTIMSLFMSPYAIATQGWSRKKSGSWISWNLPLILVVFLCTFRLLTGTNSSGVWTRQVHAVAETWRRVWGDGKLFRGPKFLNDVLFGTKFPFSPPKILMTFFVIGQFFWFSPSLFRFSVSLLCKMSYMTLSSQEKPLFQKKFLDDIYFFTLFVLSRPSDNTTFQNIGGTNALAVPPTSNFGGPFPLGLRPWSDVITFPQGVT